MVLNPSMIKSAYIHKTIVKQIHEKRDVLLKDGASIYDLALYIENAIIEEGGSIAFPVGICVNHCVAHYTPSIHDANLILKAGDMVKIDFGVHVDGEITDSAFTILVNGDFDDQREEEKRHMIDISKRATMIGVNMCRVDARLSEIGEEIEEYVESKGYRTFKELCGHSIAPYIIHAGKAVPNGRLDFDYPVRACVGEKYAIEPFITNGAGVCIYKRPNNHFMLSRNHRVEYAKNQKQLPHVAEVLYRKIDAYYKSLPFTQRWLEKDGHLNSALDVLVNYKICDEFLPIYDVEGSLVAHHEHNVYITECGAIHLTKSAFY